MRGFTRFLFGLIFVIATFILVMVFTLKSTVFSLNYVKTRLIKYDVYNKVYPVIPDITKTLIGKAEEKELESGEAPLLSGEQIGRVISNSVTPAILKEKTEGFLSGFYAWLYGSGPTIPELSLLDLKPKLENFAAAEMGVPLEFVQSSGSEFKVPEKIQIRTIPHLLILRQIYSHYDQFIIILLAISLTSLAVFIALSGNGLENYIKRPGTPLIFLSIWIALTGVIFWLFPNAENLMYREIAKALGTGKTTTVAFGLANEIVMDILRKLLIISGAFMVLGVVLKITAHFIKKAEVKRFQERNGGN